MAAPLRTSASARDRDHVGCALTGPPQTSPSSRNQLHPSVSGRTPRCFDFELPASGIDAITAPNKDEAGRAGPSPDQFDYIPR